MSKINLILTTVIGLFFTIPTLADIPAPPVAQEIRIEIDKNYSDYQFYLCSYKLEVKPNPNPPHPSRPNMIVSIPDSFEQKPIDLTTDKPITQPINSFINYRSDKLSSRVFYIAAIKKSQAADLEAKIKDVIVNSTKIDGILTKPLEDTLELKGSDNKGATVVVNKISVDQGGLQSTIEEGTSASISNTGKCIGLGLFLTGIVFISGWWTRKKFLH